MTLKTAKKTDAVKHSPVPLAPGGTDRKNKNEGRFHLLSLFLRAFVWFPWKVLLGHFPEIAQLFVMITGHRHFPNPEL